MQGRQGPERVHVHEVVKGRLQLHQARLDDVRVPQLGCVTEEDGLHAVYVSCWSEGVGHGIVVGYACSKGDNVIRARTRCHELGYGICLLRGT